MIFSDSSHLFFFVYLLIPRELRRFVGIWLVYACVSTLLIPPPLSLSFLYVCLLGYFSFCASVFRFHIWFGRKKNNQKSLAAFLSLSPAGPVSSSQRRIFDSKMFTFPPTFFPLSFCRISLFRNMSAPIRIACQRSHPMLIMCACRLVFFPFFCFVCWFFFGRGVKSRSSSEKRWSWTHNKKGKKKEKLVGCIETVFREAGEKERS